MFCNRAARFAVSPTTPRSCASPEPRRSPTTTIPVAIPTRTMQRRPGERLQFWRSLDNRKTGLHGVLGVVLMRLGTPKICEHSVAGLQLRLAASE